MLQDWANVYGARLRSVSATVEHTDDDTFARSIVLLGCPSLAKGLRTTQGPPWSQHVEGEAATHLIGLRPISNRPALSNHLEPHSDVAFPGRAFWSYLVDTAHKMSGR